MVEFARANDVRGGDHRQAHRRHRRSARSPRLARPVPAGPGARPARHPARGGRGPRARAPPRRASPRCTSPPRGSSTTWPCATRLADQVRASAAEIRTGHRGHWDCSDAGDGQRADHLDRRRRGPRGGELRRPALRPRGRVLPACAPAPGSCRSGASTSSCAPRPPTWCRGSSTRCPTPTSRSSASTSPGASTARSTPGPTPCWPWPGRATGGATWTSGELWDTLTYPGFRTLARRHLRQGAGGDGPLGVAAHVPAQPATPGAGADRARPGAGAGRGPGPGGGPRRRRSSTTS